MHIFLWCGQVVNRGQQNFGGLLYVGSNWSYFFENNNNNDDDDDNNNKKKNSLNKQVLVCITLETMRLVFRKNQR